MFQKKFGFTIIELLVVTSIIVLISSLSLANYRSGKVRYSLGQSVQKLASDLRRAQNLAIGGTSIKGVYCGYGIKVDINARPYSYYLYADKSANCGTGNNAYDAGDDIIEEVRLFSGIRINSSSPSPADIFFKPPEPITYINQNSSVGLSGIITLEAEGYSLPTRTIRISTVGLIQIE